jgi:hypothetical protein
VVIAGIALLSLVLAGASPGDEQTGSGYSSGYYETPPRAQGIVEALSIDAGPGRIVGGLILLAPRMNCTDGGKPAARPTYFQGYRPFPAVRVSRGGHFDGTVGFAVRGATARILVAERGDLRGNTAKITVTVPSFTYGPSHTVCSESKMSVTASHSAAAGSLFQTDGPVSLTLQPTYEHIGQTAWLASASVTPSQISAEGIRMFRVWTASGSCSSQKNSLRTHSVSRSGRFDFLDAFTFLKPGQYFLCADVQDIVGNPAFVSDALPQPWQVGPVLVCQAQEAFVYSTPVRCH